MKFVTLILFDENGEIMEQIEFQVVYKNGVEIYVPGAGFWVLAQPNTVIECTYAVSDLTILDDETELLQDTVCVIPLIDGYLLSHLKIAGEFEIVMTEPLLASLSINGEFEIDINEDLLKQ